MSARCLLLVSCLLAACGGSQGEPAPEHVARTTPASAPSAAAKPEDQLVVFAAASLRDAFTRLGDTFEAAHSEVKVTFNFAGTQELRTQLEQGAQVDVFAAADPKHMDALKAAGRVSDPKLFARNEPVIIVARESAKNVRGLADLQKLQKLVIGVPEVPIGRYTLQILERASAKLGPQFPEKTLARVASRELNVRQVLAKVSLGEADAGVVYRTDALSLKEGTDRITVVDIAPDFNVIAEYPIAVVSDAPHPTLARAWVELVQSDAGQQTLRGAGFVSAHDATASTAAAPSGGAAK